MIGYEARKGILLHRRYSRVRISKKGSYKIMKIVKTKEAAGQVLCHDMTQIIPGVSKDARFKKGHIVTEADIPLLLSMGKENLYVWENDEGKYHGINP